MKARRLLLTALSLLAYVRSASAIVPRPAEFLTCRAWSDRVFLPALHDQPVPGLKLLFADVNDGVTRGKSWRGTPFQLGDKTYSHGLAFNSTKHILVQLGKPGRRFTANVGLENNDDTRRGALMGNGSVTFHVLLAGREVFSTPVMRLKDAPKSVDLPLNGATEFEIRVGDGGDGRGWDQALWAEAVVSLEDGSSLRLQDLPWLDGPQPNPFGYSFLYARSNSALLFPHWPRQPHEERLDSTSTRREMLTRDPATGLEIKAQATQFEDFPAVEWVVYLTNTQTNNTPLLEDIQAIDSLLPVAASTAVTLHWSKGGVASFDDFAPQQAALKPGVSLRLSAGEGRSSSQILPFFNFEGASGGMIAAIGWSGNWVAEFASDSRGQVTMKAGLGRTHLVLYPGETIRTPRMLLLFYEGDRWRGQNLLRQFILAHHRPRLSGQPLVAPITCGNWGGTAAAVHLDNIHKITQHDLPIDYYWIDAEWYGQGSWPVNVGNWAVKSSLYPEGFKPLSDALRAAHRELMLWFEPERVYQGTPWASEYRPWLLDIKGDNFLWNLGDPAARRFLTDFICSKISEFGLGCYRQDFNMDPLPYWRAADAPDRQGMAEIRHIDGLYAFWDELLARNPSLLIDNCASGGRRLDLETLGRATPFWRTDGPRDPIAHQCHTYGLLTWVPLSATSQDRARDDYEFRSSMCSALCLNWWVAGDVPAERIPDDFPFDWAKATLAQYLKLRPFYYGDYYPLTSYSQAADVWMAYELNLEESGKGLVVALRRPESPYQIARFQLHGIDESASYRLTNLDSKAQTVVAGNELTHAGLEISLAKQPGSALILFEKR
jgi:alpha-galactosidase